MYSNYHMHLVIVWHKYYILMKIAHSTLQLKYWKLKKVVWHEKVLDTNVKKDRTS